MTWAGKLDWIQNKFNKRERAWHPTERELLENSDNGGD